MTKGLSFPVAGAEAGTPAYDLIFTLASNEPRNSGFHHFIQPLSGLNSIDFVKRVFREGRDVEILSRAGRALGCGKQSRAPLHRPSQQYLCGCLSNSRGDSRNDRIFQRPRPRPMT